MKTNRRRTQRGFSLIELLIAMVVLAIGIMATMAMQFIALAGYSAARDGTAAADVGRAVEQRLKAEILQWSPTPGAESALGEIDPIYEYDDVYVDESLLSLVDGSEWVWQPVFIRPVDHRLTVQGQQRYCAYVSGGRIRMNSRVLDAYRVQIAVVYPAARGTFATTAEPQGICPDLGNDKLDPSSPNTLEIDGLRAQYFGTVVRAPTR
jgi:prepilin-type N-terminal cleavage/methylation domain-containing protein